MLQHTFIHIPGIGSKTEQFLWANRIRSWDDALSTNFHKTGRLPAGLRRRLLYYIPKSVEALKKQDTSFFHRLVEKGQSWRAFREFENNCVFLDIETTGLSPVFDRVTLVGLYDGSEYKVFVEGHNLENFKEILKRYSVVVTFNGSLFDLRFLKTFFPETSLPPIHIDLRFATRRLGLRGGLKEVERALGLRRKAKVEQLTGYDATVLWSKYMRGDEAALDLLIQYNQEDTVNLKQICEVTCEKLAIQTGRVAGKSFSSNGKQSVSSASPVAFHRTRTGLGQPGRLTVQDLLKKTRPYETLPRIVGIDLTGSKRPSGWALLEGDQVWTKRLRADEEILQETINTNPDLVSIDSPLSLPVARTRAKARIYRQCELALRKMGISVFWALLPSMKSLTLRGIRLAEALRKKGLKVIESYPGAAQDILQIPRKKASLEELRRGLRHAGIRGDFVESRVTHDEVDAITSALVGLFYLAGEYIPLGNPQEDYLIVPRPPRLDMVKLENFLSMLDLDKPSKLLA